MKLAPDAFWRLSLAEWRWLLSATTPAGDRLTLSEFESLAALYPDDGSVRSSGKEPPTPSIPAKAGIQNDASYGSPLSRGRAGGDVRLRTTAPQRAARATLAAQYPDEKL